MNTKLAQYLISEKAEEKSLYWGIVPNADRDYDQNEFWIIEVAKRTDEFKQELYDFVKVILDAGYAPTRKMGWSISVKLNKYNEEGEFFTDSLDKMRQFMEKFFDKQLKKLESNKNKISKIKS